MLYLVRYTERGSEDHVGKRKLAEDILQNIKSKVPNLKIEQAKGRLFLTSDQPLENILGEIHGIASFSPCISFSLKELDRKILEYAQILKDKKSFAVKVKRVGKHSFKSQGKAAELGEKILEKYPHLKVNFKNPKETIFVEIRDNDCFVFNKIIPGIDQTLQKTSSSESKFIVDDMLGKLAKRLRMMGFDVAYPGVSADSLLLRISKEESRIILTSDTNLVKIKSANAVLIESKKLIDQIKEVIQKAELKLDFKNMFSRCSICNGKLQKIEKEKIKDKVPSRVYELFNEFSFCPKCDKIYWRGTHYEKLMQELGGFIF